MIAFVKQVGSFTNENTSATSMSVTVPAGGIPAGQTLLIRSISQTSNTTHTASDSRGNTYVEDAHVLGAQRVLSVSRGKLTTALQEGDTITITLGASRARRNMTVDAWEGIDQADGGAGSATGTSTTPSATKTPTEAGLLLGVVVTSGSTADAFSEDADASGGAAWSTLTRVGTSGGSPTTVNSAYKVASSQVEQIYNPVLGTSQVWVEALVAYSAIPTTGIMRFRESPPLSLHSEVETPNGRFYRWGKDEPQPENIPSGRSFSTTMPGGFDQESVTLPRKPGVQYADLERLSTLRAIGAGGEVACETRLERTPRTSGDQFSIGPESKGWIAHCEDDQSAAEIYIDADLSQWGEGSTERKIELLPYNTRTIEASTGFQDAGDTAPSIIFKVNFEDGHPLGEMWYYGGGVPVGKVKYDFNNLSGGLAGFHDLVRTSATDILSGVTASGPDHGTSSASNQELESGSSQAKYALVQSYYEGVYAGAGTDSKAWTNLKVLGNHELDVYGTWPSIGLLASDIVAYALTRWAPLLKLSSGSQGSVRPSSFLIPHLEFRDKTTALAMVEGANRYELRSYAVWEDRAFYYHEWGDRGRRWRTRVAPSQLAETGPTVDRLRNGVIVSYQDVDGTTRTVGPPGSGCYGEDEALLDTDPENPANQRGIRVWGPPVDMGGVSIESEAIRVGALYLQRLKETDTSGQMQLVATVEDDRGIVRPAWQVRAGDTIVPVDASDTRERRIVRTSYNEDTFTNTIDLDAPPDGTPDLLAQLGVSITDLGL